MEKSAKPFVSVVIPAYNAKETIANCIDALLAQKYPKDAYEIIVIDDASEDNTQAVLENYKSNSLVKIIRHAENQALAAARNSGIKIAQGEILIFVDADITVLPDFITRHVKYFDKPQLIGVLSQLTPGPDIKCDKYQRYLYESKRGAKKYSNKNAIPFNTFLFTASSVRKSIIYDIGCFDDKIIKYGGEDTEFAYRLWRRYPQGLYYAPQIKVIHHHYRPFNDALNKVRTFGKEVVPYLVQKHRNFDGLYGYSFIYPPSTISGFAKRVIGLIVRLRITFTFLKLFYFLFPYPISNLFIRLLLASALWQGVAESENDSVLSR